MKRETWIEGDGWMKLVTDRGRWVDEVGDIDRRRWVDEVGDMDRGR
jgi:hypothetical protein